MRAPLATSAHPAPLSLNHLRSLTHPPSRPSVRLYQQSRQEPQRPSAHTEISKGTFESTKVNMSTIIDVNPALCENFSNSLGQRTMTNGWRTSKPSKTTAFINGCLGLDLGSDVVVDKPTTSRVYLSGQVIRSSRLRQLR
jgi:hypothetical protein